MHFKIIGLNVVPNVGETFKVCDDESHAKEVADARSRLSKISAGMEFNSANKAQALSFLDGNVIKREIIKIPVVIKCDVAGSVEALTNTINNLMESDENSMCKIDIIYSGIGEVTSSDVAIAAISKAKIFSFKVSSGSVVLEEARAKNVELKSYNVVYDLIDELNLLLKKSFILPAPGILIGKSEIKKIFTGKGGKIAGSIVTEGSLKLDSKVRILRGNRNSIYSGSFDSLRILKDNVNEVPNGSECGISFKDFDEFDVGDIIECFTID